MSEAIGAGLLAAGHRRVNFAIVGSGPNGASPHHEAGRARHRRGRHGGVRLRRRVRLARRRRLLLRHHPHGGGGRARAPRCADCYAVLLAAQQAAVAAVRPGVTAEHVDAVARAVIADAGLGEYFIHRTGHGIGIEEHEDPYLVAGQRDAAGRRATPSRSSPASTCPAASACASRTSWWSARTGPSPLNTVDHSLVVVDGWHGA